ncbi:MAG: Fic family protein [Betaproteobacteria bacterium HGW-Betaproteobacteria-6]|jgi:Fic family protein|nr:MAG: Fic family protein [Betaproteobacteria bacterium HGW-Betaproteobacteria-6]
MQILDEIADIERFEPRGATLDYIEEVEESINEIDAQRPLAAHILDKLQKEILYDRVHASAVIEGNRLSRRETIVVLSSGIVEAGSRKDQQEVINLADCCAYLQDSLDAKADLSIHLIKELHQKLLANIDQNNAGRFRSVDVAITGAKITPPSHLDVPHLVEVIVDQANKNGQHPLQKAAWLHWAFARVHPFSDGNGRIARLLQDYLLLRDRYVPATVQPEDRERNYYDALEQADLGDGLAFLEIVAKNTLRTAERYLAIIREEKARNDWIKSIAKAASEKVKQSEHRRFLALQRAYDSIKLEFSNLCGELSHQLGDVFIGFRDYGSLDYDKYQDLKSKGRASRTWLFGMHIKYGELDQRFIFWYAVHYAGSGDTRPFENGTITLLVSIQDSAGGYRKLDEIDEDRITLREIVATDRTFMRRRYNPVTKKFEWDQDISASDIAKNLLQEILAKVGLI